jgi:hypothetical protein
VVSVDNHPSTEWLQLALDPLDGQGRQLRRRLWLARKVPDNVSGSGGGQEPLVRDVTHVHHTGQGHHVVLAEGPEGDPLAHDFRRAGVVPDDQPKSFTCRAVASPA